MCVPPLNIINYKNLKLQMSISCATSIIYLSSEVSKKWTPETQSQNQCQPLDDDLQKIRTIWILTQFFSILNIHPKLKYLIESKILKKNLELVIDHRHVVVPRSTRMNSRDCGLGILRCLDIGVDLDQTSISNWNNDCSCYQ